MPPRRPRDISSPPHIMIMSLSDSSRRHSRERSRDDMDSTHRRRRKPSTSRPRESSSSQPRVVTFNLDARSSKSSQHEKKRIGGGDARKQSNHRRQRSSASGIRGSSRRRSSTDDEQQRRRNTTPRRRDDDCSFPRITTSTPPTSTHLDSSKTSVSTAQTVNRLIAEALIVYQNSNSNTKKDNDLNHHRTKASSLSSFESSSTTIKEAQINNHNHHWSKAFSSSSFESSPSTKEKQDNDHNHHQSKKSSSPSLKSSSFNKKKDKHNKDIEKILSLIPRVNERAAQSHSRDRGSRRSKRNTDPWSKDGTGSSSCRSMKNSSSASTLTAKSSSGSSSFTRGGHSMKSSAFTTLAPAKGSCSGSLNTSKTCCSTPPLPPPPPRRSSIHPPFSLVLHKSAMTSALVLSTENDDHAMSNSQPTVSPAVVRSKSREGSSSPRGVATPSPNARVPRPPPPAYLKRGRSYRDMSSSSNSLLFRKSPPPPPPPRRTTNKGALQQNGQHRSLLNFSSLSLNNTYGIIPVSNAIVPFKANNAIVPAAVKSTTSNKNTQQLQLSLKHRSSSRIISKKTHPVSSMEYTDPYGDAGIYSGEVDDSSLPHGKGKMKYDNGIFYEGNWIHGYKDESQGNSAGDQMTNVTRDRILSGFTSWKGQKKKAGKGVSGNSGTFVYGMEWADLAGLSGKYTGHVNADDVPNGKGVMKYEFGLVAEGEWIKGKLNDGGGGGMNGVMAAQSQSVVPGGMSVAGGAATVVSGLGMMSIGGPGGGGMMMGGYPNVMMSPHYMNTSTPAASLAAAAYCNPAGTIMGGATLAAASYHGMMNHPAAAAATGGANVPTHIF